MEGKIKTPEIRARAPGPDLSKFIVDKKCPPKEEDAMKDLFNEWTNLIKILKDIKDKMKLYIDEYQDDIYK